MAEEENTTVVFSGRIFDAKYDISGSAILVDLEYEGNRFEYALVSSDGHGIAPFVRAALQSMLTRGFKIKEADE